MTREEMVELLRTDVPAWNRWRRENPYVEIDLHGADLRNANLSGASLWYANLSGANFTFARMTHITLCGATIDGARVDPEDIGGPGHILCALTDQEWDVVQSMREKEGKV